MGRLIEQQAVIECLTNTAEYYDMPQADEWTKGIHYGLLHGIDNILDNVKPVEAIPKADYENRLKADMVAMLTEIQMEIEELQGKYSPYYDEASKNISWVIQEKINELKGDQEGEEPITIKNDCEHCAKTYGTLGCCSTVSNEWVYSCKEGHEEYARGMRKFGTTTKNDLGVDCISRTRAIERLKLNFPISQGADNSRDRHRYMQALADLQAIKELPSVTPIRPKGRWIDKQHLFGSCSAECSSCHKRSDGFVKDSGFSLEYKYYDFCPNCGAKMESEE